MIDALGRVGSVLLLGGTSEIGIATTQALISVGAREVIAAARHPDQIPAAALRDAGADTVDVFKFDARDTDTHAGLLCEVFERDRDIDVAILAFGMLDGSPIHLAEINYVGAISTLVPLAELMQQQGHGTLVVLSSVAAERARASNFPYGSSKAGLDSFAQGLGARLHGTGVEVLVVRPGFVRTKMTSGMKPAPLSTTPDAVANVIVKGLRTRARVVWAPGVLRWVFLVLRMLPRGLFRRLDL